MFIKSNLLSKIIFNCCSAITRKKWPGWLEREY